MGYSYESFSTIPTEGVEPRDDDPDGWSGDVNTNVQVSHSVCRMNGNG